MTKWIDCLKEYNRNKRVWCTPRKGTRSYAKVMQCVSGDKNAFVKKKKLKVVEKFEDEKPRDIQDNPDIVVQMKRATINDVPQDVMNNIMGQFLDVKDKANLASVGVKVKMTDEEKEEAKEKSYNYNKYMEVIDNVRELKYKQESLDNMLIGKLDKIKTPNKYEDRFTYEKLKLVEVYIDRIRRFLQTYFIGPFKMGLSNKVDVLPVIDGKFHIRKSYRTLKEYGKLELFYTNSEIYNAMNLPNLSKNIQEKTINEFNEKFNEYNNNYPYYVNLIKVLNKNILNPTTINKVFRYAIIYSAVKGNYVKPNIKLSYNVDKINKKLLNLDNLSQYINWGSIITTNYGFDDVVKFKNGDKALQLSSQKEYINPYGSNKYNNDKYSYRRIEYDKTDYPLIFNLNHRSDPFTTKDFIKMENDVEKIRNNFKEDDIFKQKNIDKYKKFIDDKLSVFIEDEEFNNEKQHDQYLEYLDYF